MDQPITPSDDGWRDVSIAEDVLPLGHVLLSGARRWPDRDAIVFPDARSTYLELADEAWQIARSLAGLGIQRRDHVGVLMTNRRELIASVFGISLLGAVVVPINARYRDRELTFMIGDCDLAAIVTHTAGPDTVDFAELLHRSLPGLEHGEPGRLALDDYPLLRFVARLDAGTTDGLMDRRTFDDAAGRADGERLQRSSAGVALRDTALIVYTSGTTSQPRGAIITHEGFVRTWMAAGQRFGCGDGDRFWNPLPLFHVAALGPMIFTLSRGGTFITDYSFDPGRALAQIEREGATLLYPTYPAVVQGLLNHPSFAETDLSSVEAYCAIGPPATLADCQAQLPSAVLLSTYGGTEAGILTISDREDSEEDRLQTCGQPLPGLEVKIVDPETLVELPVGEPGEILMRGYNTFEGYYNDPEKTAEAQLGDGWLRVGDRGVLGHDGHLLFLGRLTDMIKVGGENVAPAEVEAHLLKHPSVHLAQIVGMPDPRLDEVPVAFVELVQGEVVTQDELIEFCRGRLASFKVPRLVRFVSEWPTSATKIQRSALRDALLAELVRSS